MIAIDTSSLSAYLSGQSGKDTEEVDFALQQRQGALPPVVISEILSDPKLSREIRNLILDIPSLSLHEGYWERAGLLRSMLISAGRKMPLADSLISQICIDHQVPLITRDSDFQVIARHTNLKLK